MNYVIKLAIILVFKIILVVSQLTFGLFKIKNSTLYQGKDNWIINGVYQGEYHLCSSHTYHDSIVKLVAYKADELSYHGDCYEIKCYNSSCNNQDLKGYFLSCDSTQFFNNSVVPGSTITMNAFGSSVVFSNYYECINYMANLTKPKQPEETTSIVEEIIGTYHCNDYNQLWGWLTGIGEILVIAGLVAVFSRDRQLNRFEEKMFYFDCLIYIVFLSFNMWSYTEYHRQCGANLMLLPFIFFIVEIFTFGPIVIYSALSFYFHPDENTKKIITKFQSMTSLFASPMNWSFWFDNGSALTLILKLYSSIKIIIRPSGVFKQDEELPITIYHFCSECLKK